VADDACSDGAERDINLSFAGGGEPSSDAIAVHTASEMPWVQPTACGFQKCDARPSVNCPALSASPLSS
jgi:hypothetical protein